MALREAGRDEGWAPLPRVTCIKTLVGRRPDLLAEPAGGVDPRWCDHTGSHWSANLAVRCGTCGVPLFLPPGRLAFKPRRTIEAMYSLWCAAGWPRWDASSQDWCSVDPEHWRVLKLPYLFPTLPVRRDREAQFVLTYDDVVERALEACQTEP